MTELHTKSNKSNKQAAAAASAVDLERREAVAAAELKTAQERELRKRDATDHDMAVLAPLMYEDGALLEDLQKRSEWSDTWGRNAV